MYISHQKQVSSRSFHDYKFPEVMKMLDNIFLVPGMYKKTRILPSQVFEYSLTSEDD